MIKTIPEGLPDKIIHLMIQSGIVSAKEGEGILRYGEIGSLKSDGSCRHFYRISLQGSDLCLAVVPCTAEGNDLAESRSAFFIGNHLAERGVPVPGIHGWDEESGIILFEDLGDVRLDDLSDSEGGEDLRLWYRQAIDGLVHMQLSGIDGFDPDWCYDTPRYDRELMIARESLYFLKAFWQDVLGQKAPVGIEEEFAAIASFVDGKVPDVFLHRDFQSRNIMIKDARVRFIDYQAGRLGPPGYDLASLLIDPYAALDPEFQDEMVRYYLAVPAVGRTFSLHDIKAQYPFLALQRNLQIIGAFSFLNGVRKKTFFSNFIVPSLSMLRIRLQEQVFADFTVLRKMVDAAVKSYRMT